ncbi:BsuPI-related putative proteinase inhibitor [Bacillus sp. FJAT-27251]|uniref:BsuPI-related putative proteinase inhibitor n=1 Tax=Bacillus sp. FJAT-27251 TaxID=1684142 RepID=UPI0006A773AF|nr:BsuPI-related putative proteinase inhibitor [Bacillus sp. FJAT-27251]
MKKFSFFLVFLVLVSIPLWTMGAESADNGPDLHFFVEPIAGPEKVTFELVLRNGGSTPLALEFPSAQLYEIQVKDRSGKELYRYSSGKAFAQALQTVRLAPGEAISWKETWDYQGETGRIPEGEYKVIAELKANKANSWQIKPLVDEKETFVPGENLVFRQVKASGKKGIYKVEGKVRPGTRHFFYTVEDGHHEQIGEKRVEVEEGGDWKAFKLEIKIPAEELPESGTLILHLYERSQEGSIVHGYPVILERF